MWDRVVLDSSVTCFNSDMDFPTQTSMVSGNVTFHVAFYLIRIYGEAQPARMVRTHALRDPASVNKRRGNWDEVVLSGTY